MDSMDLDNYEPVIRIVVIGCGGAGNNAVNRMIDDRIDNVEFYVLNTDKQALATSKAPNRIVIGEDVTQGLGAGGDPSVGKAAAEQSEEKIREIVRGANMVFIAAGMGGGTGTGSSPVVAKIAKEEGALTIAIVTRPFIFEGKTRIANSCSGLNELKDAVDSIIIVSNDKLLASRGNVPISQAFAESDKVLAQSVKTVVELILLPAVINLDFADVKSILKNSGIALIGFGEGHGDHKSQEAAENAINSPLLEASIAGARKAICAITCGSDVSLFEAQECVNRITATAGTNLEIIFGVSINPQLGDGILASVIASDFSEEYDFTSVARPMPNAPSIPSFSDPIANLSKANDVPSEQDDDSVYGDNILPDFLKNGI